MLYCFLGSLFRPILSVLSVRKMYCPVGLCTCTHPVLAGLLLLLLELTSSETEMAPWFVVGMGAQPSTKAVYFLKCAL